VCPVGTRTTLLVVGSDGTRKIYEKQTGTQGRQCGTAEVEGSNFSWAVVVVVVVDVGSRCLNFSCTTVDPSSVLFVPL
jgi:hypothetical protein